MQSDMTLESQKRLPLLQRLCKHIPTVTNRRTVGRYVFCVVRVVSDIQCVVRGKWVISSSQNILCAYILLWLCYIVSVSIFSL